MKQKTLKFFYKNILKQIFFAIDPEKVHDHMMRAGKFLGRNSAARFLTKKVFSFSHESLEQDVLGIHFKNPIGLSAGFDKNAELTQILPSVGFGFEEIGSITGEWCEGNPKPRLWRHPEKESLRVYYGLKNNGCEEISTRLSQLTFETPIGVSIAKTNHASTVEVDDGIRDYIKAYKAFKGIGAYTTINISCPNAFGGQPFTDPRKLEMLLDEINRVRDKKPIFIKLSPDLTIEEINAIARIARDQGVNGLISSNLVKKHDLGLGGLSGKPVSKPSNQHLKFLYKNYRDDFVLIGCGGVFTAEDAYEKIKAGASLIQLITGMIFEGPQVIGEINKGLVELLKKDGYSNISEAVGADHR